MTKQLTKKTKTLTKVDMIDQIAKKAEISKTAARVALDAFVAMCSNEVKAGRNMRVAGLGTFSLKKSKARKGMNPKTQQVIKIPSKKRMAFKPSSYIKNMLNPVAK